MLKTGRIVVGLTPVNLTEQLGLKTSGGVGLVVKNDGPGALHIGGSGDVTISTDSFSMADGDTWADNLKSGDIIWAVSNASAIADCIATGS